MTVSARRRAPVHLQATAAECGLACVAMMLSVIGRWTVIRELRTLADPGRDGLSLRTLRDLLAVHGVDAVGVRTEDVAALPLPAILTWGEAHYVLLERVNGRHVLVVDPAHGRRRIGRAELAEHFGGVALVPRSAGDLVPRPRPPTQFWSFVRPHLIGSAPRVVLLLALGLLLTMVGAVPALLSQVVIDTVIPADDRGPLGLLSVGALVLAVASFWNTLWRSEITVWFERRLDASLMSAVLVRLLSLPYRFFQLRSAGDLLVRLGSTSFVRDVLSGRLVGTAVDSVFVVAYVGLVAMRSWQYVAAIVLLTIVQLAVITGCAGAARRRAEVELTETAAAQSVLLETVRGIEMVKGLNLARPMLHRWSVAFDRQLAAGVARARLDNLLSAVLDSVAFLAPLGLLLLGAGLVMAHELSLGSMVALNALAMSALAPVRSIGTNFQVLQTVRVHLARLRDILDEPSEEVRAGLPARALTGAITLEDVSFRYGTASPRVVEGVTCSIAPGSFVAVVGPSGSGKSTLARLLLGLLEPEHGTARFDGLALDDLNIESLRDQCGIVNQEAEILSGSISANVRAGRPGVDGAAVLAALESASMLDDVEAMPLGLLTPLGESGVGLSGGQRQRLALARALAARPRILVLDEATSNLDGETERRVTERLASAATTRVVIAHRLSTVRDADQILFLDRGRLARAGRHEELLADERYRAFVGTQMAAGRSPS